MTGLIKLNELSGEVRDGLPLLAKDVRLRESGRVFEGGLRGDVRVGSVETARLRRGR